MSDEWIRFSERKPPSKERLYEVRKEDDVEIYNAIWTELTNSGRQRIAWHWKWNGHWVYWRDIQKQPKSARCPNCHSHEGHYANCRTRFRR